jgi:N-acetylglucosamine-6-phosphate deacetylase
MEFTGAPLEQALRLLTVNPASMTGLGDLVGSVALGRPASLVALDGAGNLVGSVVNGEQRLCGDLEK